MTAALIAIGVILAFALLTGAARLADRPEAAHARPRHRESQDDEYLRQLAAIRAELHHEPPWWREDAPAGTQDVPGREPPGSPVPAAKGESAPAPEKAGAAHPAGDHNSGAAEPAAIAAPETHYSAAATERALTGDIHGTLACGAYHWGFVTDNPSLVTCEPCKDAMGHDSGTAPEGGALIPRARESAAPETPGPAHPPAPGPGDLAHDIAVTAALARSIAGKIRGLQPGEYRELIEGEGMAYTQRRPFTSYLSDDTIARGIAAITDFDAPLSAPAEWHRELEEA